MKTIIHALQAWTKKEISKIPAVEPDWNENDPNKDSYIKNKPTNLATKQDVLDLANATKEYVDSVSVSFEVEQNLTEEQKKIARKNICLYDWKTFSDEWGKHVYATNHRQSSLKYEIAQTIVNVTGNGSVSALEDIVSWADGLELYTQNPSEDSFEQVQGIVKNYKALYNGGAVQGSLFFYKAKYIDLRDPNAVYTTVGVFKSPIQSASYYYSSHWITCECDDIIAKYYYDEETDSMLHVDFRYKCVDKELEKLGYAADAKVVGDALALKADIKDTINPPVTAAIGQTIVVKSVDANGKPTEWEAVDLAVSTNGFELIDRTTGAAYNVFIDNGKLTMEAVDE